MQSLVLYLMVLVQYVRIASVTGHGYGCWDHWESNNNAQMRNVGKDT